MSTATESNSPLRTGDLESAPAEREGGLKVSTLHQGLHSKLVTLRESITGAVGRSRAYWVPPSLLTKPPASVMELSAYAHRAGWTSSRTGPVRAFGIGWWRVFGLPVTVLCRYIEWFAQRPARGLVAAFIWITISRSVPGLWFIDNIVRPILAAAAWVFLP